MANNDMFTLRNGKQIPVKEVVIPKSVVVSLLRLQEDYIEKKEAAKLLSVTLDVIERGIKSKRQAWKGTEIAKNERTFARGYAKLLQMPHSQADVDALAKACNVQKGEKVEMSESTSVTEDALLEALMSEEEEEVE